MDLYAYLQIEDLEAVASANGINVPRLRGLRLMSEEEPYTREEIAEAMHNIEMQVFDDACVSVPAFCPDSCASRFGPATRRRQAKYLIREKVLRKFFGKEIECEETVGFRWDLIHGKRKKAIRFAIKKRQRAQRANIEAWNRYAGRDGVILIHARIGGDNWNYYGGPELAKQPWFLEKVDDAFDCTYCDIYAKIQPINKDRKEE